MKTKEEIERRADAEVKLSLFLAEQIRNATTYFGYPEVPENNDLSILGISGLAKLHLNNAGDPWVHGNAKMHTKEFEREVLEFVAKIYHIEDDFWGYITSGGTEGNLYGAYMSREFFQARKLKPVLLYSEETHYSVPKNARLLGIDSRKVNCQTSGEISYKDFEEHLKHLEDNHGIIFNFNLGTTMKGAHDNIDKINEIISRLGIDRERILIHADAALNGFIYPFVNEDHQLFSKGVTSISISGHKFPGAIHPCGIVLTKKQIHTEAFGDQWVPYVGTNDTTISGSRNGFLALNLWYLFQKKGVQGIKEEAIQCLENARYLVSKLVELNYPNISMFPKQIIVTFKKPAEEIVKKYQLATQDDLAHIVVMQHITKNRIDAFCEDLAKTISD